MARAAPSARPIEGQTGVGDHLIFMDEGLIVEQGPPSEVLDHPQHERTKQFLSRLKKH